MHRGHRPAAAAGCVYWQRRLICSVMGRCHVGQHRSHAKAVVAWRASVPGVQQGLERSLAALPGQLQLLPQPPIGLASLHERAHRI